MAGAQVSLQIDGQARLVPAGSTLAAVAGGLRVSVGGELRSAFCGMGVCHECRVRIDGRSALACQTVCVEGMRVQTDVGSWPGFDGGARVVRVGPTVAGNLTDAALLAAAPVAGAPPSTPPSHSRRPDCDILIVGAGPAGLAAALAAAPSGTRIVVIDDNPQSGGQIWRDGPAASLPAAARAQRDAVARCANVELLCGWRVAAPAAGEGSTRAVSATHITQATDSHHAVKGFALLLESAHASAVQRCTTLILCSGARELLLPFPGWTLPGVTGAGGLQALIKGGLPVAGQRVVIAGSGPLLLASAATARAAGAQVLRIAEQATWPALLGFAAQLWRWPGKVAQALSLADTAYRGGSQVLTAHGERKLQSLRLRQGGRDIDIACDRLACGFGLVPNTGLGQVLGCGLSAQRGLLVNELQASTVAGIFAAGECTGIGGSERAQLQGAIAGHAAVGEHAAAQALQPQLAHWQGFADALQRRFALQASVLQLATPDTLICRCEDVPLAALQGCDNWLDAKLRTRCGMGACQGRICGAAAQVLLGWAPAPPRHLVWPVRVGSLAAAGQALD